MDPSKPVVVRLHGRAGNHMYQYALMRVLAERHGFEWGTALHCPENNCLPPLFPDLPKGDGSARPDQEWTQVHKGGEVYPYIQSGKTALDGWFQDHESLDIIDSRREDMKKWFTPPAEEMRRAREFWEIQGRTACCVNVRGGDYIQYKAVLPPWWYEPAMLEVKKELGTEARFVCVTDDPSYASRILGKGVPTLHLSPLEDFCLLLTAPRLVCSNSTFCWWAAYLNTDRFVVAPSGIPHPTPGWTWVKARDLWHQVPMTR